MPAIAKAIKTVRLRDRIEWSNPLCPWRVGLRALDAISNTICNDRCGLKRGIGDVNVLRCAHFTGCQLGIFEWFDETQSGSSNQEGGIMISTGTEIRIGKTLVI